MKNEFDLNYSDEALISRVLYLISSTELNIFVEDTGKEYEYEEIFERLLLDEIHINLIFPTGGKSKLEEAYTLFGKSDEYGKCFFIADGDFDIALEKERINAPNFIYLKRYNIESYLLDKSGVIRFMRPKLKKTISETEELIEYENWERKITPYFKSVFALHFLVQFNKIYQLENVGRKAGFFINDKGLPNEFNFKRYLNEIEKYIPNANSNIFNTISSLENIYGTESSCFICGKYFLESLSRYLSSKLKKKKIGYEELKSFLISNFDIKSIEYVRDKLYAYIIS